MSSFRESMGWGEDVDFKEALEGKTIASVAINEAKDEILFVTANGDEYRMFHRQDCCENVYVEDITGDLNDLVGEQVVTAEEVFGERGDTEWGTLTWTFYKLRSHSADVTIRWLGESNGYYSESVDFERVPKNEQND